MNEAGKGDKCRSEDNHAIAQNWSNINWSKPIGLLHNKPFVQVSELSMYIQMYILYRTHIL